MTDFHRITTDQGDRHVTQHAKAPSPGSSTGKSPVRRTLFGVACLCVLGLMAFLGSGAPAAGADGACPNEAIRQAQHAGHLADCRAWEMVSPLDKNNGDIVADGITTIAAREGGAVAFNGRTGFADVIGWGASGQTQYLARRSANGWTTKAITPTPQPEAQQTFFPKTSLEVFSEDLRTAVLAGYDLPDASGDIPFRNNLYTEDTDTRALRTVTASETGIPPFLLSFLDSQVWGISDDAHHVAFASNTPFLQSTEGNSARNVYQWDDGVLSLAGVLPDGSVPSEGSSVPVEGNSYGYRRNMSADGSRQLFYAAPESGAQQQLYQRIDGERTAWISEPEDESFVGEPEGVRLQAATPDGRHIFFITDSPLIEADITAGPALYRWTDGPDPKGELNLTLITNIGGGDYLNYGDRVPGISDDGQVVYIHGFGDELSVWDHGAITSIGPANREGVPQNWLSALASQPGFGRVTPDGNYFAYLTGPTGKSALYLYSLLDESLTCVACQNVRVQPSVSQGPNVTSSSVTRDNVAIRPRFLADDGRTFFSTSDALVPEDVNGTLDAYQYDPATGELSLLSSGRGSEPSAFLDASASGDEVFIATRQSLVGTDTDSLVDVYSVRSGGGFSEPELQPSPCVGEGCQGSGAAAPGVAPIASTGATRGNTNDARSSGCGKGRRRVRRDGKVRCVRKKHQHPRTNRGGGK